MDGAHSHNTLHSAHTTDHLVVVSYNPTSANKHYNTIRDMAAIEQPDIICFQEVFSDAYKGKTKFFLKGYDTVFDIKFEDNRNHIIATLFNRKKVSYRELNVPDRKTPMQVFIVRKGHAMKSFNSQRLRRPAQKMRLRLPSGNHTKTR